MRIGVYFTSLICREDGHSLTLSQMKKIRRRKRRIQMKMGLMLLLMMSWHLKRKVRITQGSQKCLTLTIVKKVRL